MKDAPHPADAIKFLAFLQRPDIAARNAVATGLAAGVREAKTQVPQAAADKVIWPDDETIRRLVIAPAPEPALRKAIEREWLKVKTGSYEPAPAAEKKSGKVRPGGKAGKDAKPAAAGKDAAAPPKTADKPGKTKKPKRPGGRADG